MSFVELNPNTRWRSSNAPLPGKRFELGVTNIYIGKARIAQVFVTMVGTTTWKELRYWDRIGFVTLPMDSDARITQVIQELVPASYRTLLTWEAMDGTPAPPAGGTP